MTSVPPARRKLSSFLLYVPLALPLWKFFRGTGAAAASLAGMRRDYRLGGLSERDAAPDPFKQFEKWLGDAVAARVLEPNAMTLATADDAGAPSARTVLLKGFDARGFVFYTNYESRKARELAVHARAALLFTWLPLERQVEIRGRVEKTSREETEKYFYSRPIDSQLGAWASAQSTVLADRAQLEARIAALMKEYRGKTVPVPAHWGGYRLVPDALEFWQGRPSRLHDRLRYTRQAPDSWKIERLSP